MDTEPLGPGGRRVLYCVIPPDLAESLHEPLRRHFRDDPSVEVIVEQRAGERRATGDRRRAAKERKAERRQIRNPAGRRLGERRTPLEAAEPRELPRKARRHAKRLRFVERVEPAGQAAEDRDTARLVLRFQAGERRVFEDLYARYFERVHSYLRVALKNGNDVEDAAQEVFTKVLEALPRYQQRGKPFRAWLFTVLRNYTLDWLEKQGRYEPMDPAELDERQERQGAGATDLDDGLQALRWISDRDFLTLIKCLPLAQRQVVLLAFMGDLGSRQIAAILGRSPSDVRMLQSRALRLLREHLSGDGGDGDEPSRHVPRSGLSRCPRPAHVLRSRRYALFL